MLKALVLSVAIAGSLLLPMTINAQSDGFFRGGGVENYTDRPGFDIGSIPGGDNGLTNQTFGAPVGSGLLVLVSAGVGYVLLKKKED